MLTSGAAEDIGYMVSVTEIRVQLSAEIGQGYNRRENRANDTFNDRNGQEYIDEGNGRFN